MKKQIHDCPLGHGKLKLVEAVKSITFRDTELEYLDSFYVCPVCEIEIASVEQTGSAQRKIADAYRQKVGLLTSSDIKDNRKKFNLTQAALAKEMSLGIASIKRWETGEIQTASMDSALKHLFSSKQKEHCLTGGRSLSLPRIKLVLQYFEQKLNSKLILKGDKFLFAAKYVWYADMLSYRDLNKSMTGASYAALPYGPQLNNYRELIDEIKHSDSTTVEPLSNKEKAIIEKIVATFPEQRMVFDAAHRESIWKETKTAHIIDYTLSSSISEVR